MSGEKFGTIEKGNVISLSEYRERQKICQETPPPSSDTGSTTAKIFYHRVEKDRELMEKEIDDILADEKIEGFYDWVPIKIYGEFRLVRSLCILYNGAVYLGDNGELYYGHIKFFTSILYRIMGKCTSAVKFRIIDKKTFEFPEAVIAGIYVEFYGYNPYASYSDE